MNPELCPICSGPRDLAFSRVILGEYQAQYLKCPQCGFLGALNPTWLDQAYESPIAVVDSGVLARAKDLEPRLLCLFSLNFPKGSVYVDIGAGYGALVRTMRDAGLDFRWSDPNCPNLLAPGFELDSQACSGLTAIEVLEHTTDPVAFLEGAISRTGAPVVFLTTELLPTPIPDPDSWWYYAFSTGQHLSFFEKRTLGILAEQLGFRLRSRHSLHVLHQGQIQPWTFLLATTRLAPVVGAFIRHSLASLTQADNPLL
ncbi:MAG: class I SAM-dependent methyltransferase [Acidimicrobiales bacterium]